MNKFISDKLGEVLAFSRIGRDTLEKGEEGFLKMMSEKEIGRTNLELKKLEQRMISLSSDEGVVEDVEGQATETQVKVAAMCDMYINGKWDEADEVLEWMGFYTGAALVHWHLIAGAAKSLKVPRLVALCVDAISLYNSLIAQDEKALEKIGAERGK